MNLSSPIVLTPVDPDRIATTLLEKTPPTQESIDLLTHLSAHQLQAVLHRYYTKNSETAFKTLHTFSSLIPLEKIEAAAHDCSPLYEDTIHLAKTLAEQAQLYLSKAHHHQNNIEPWHRQLINSLTKIGLSILSLLGLEEVCLHPASSNEIRKKVQRLSDLANIFYLLTTALVPIVGVAVGGVLVTAAFAIVLIISLLNPFFQKAPLFTPYSENWSKKIKENTLPIQYAKKSCLQAIAQAMSPHGQTHPLLIGRTNEEKFNIALAFAHSVTKGEFPELIGKEIIYVKTADLIASERSSSEEPDSIAKLEQIIEPFQKNTILLLDDIHLLTQPENSQCLRHFLHFLQTHKRDSLFICAFTTKGEADQHALWHQQDLAKFLLPISTLNTDEKETVEILQRYLLENEAFETIDPQFLELLPQLLRKTGIEPYDSLERVQQQLQIRDKPSQHMLELEQKKSELKNLNIELALDPRSLFLLTQAPHRDVERLTRQVAELEEIVQNEIMQKKKRLALLEQLRLSKEIFYSCVLKIAKMQKEHLSKEDTTVLAECELIRHFFLPSLEKQYLQILRRSYNFSS